MTISDCGFRSRKTTSRVTEWYLSSAICNPDQTEIPMPQLRQDPATKEWVIIATERSKRPDDFKKIKSIAGKPPYKDDCPFCPGNEHLTLPETLAYRSGGPPNSKE